MKVHSSFGCLFRVFFNIFRVLYPSKFFLPPAQNPPHFHFIIVQKSRVDETATKRRGKSIVERGEHSKPSPPTQRPPDSVRSARVFACFFFFVVESHLVGEKEREKGGTHTPPGWFGICLVGERRRRFWTGAFASEC